LHHTVGAVGINILRKTSYFTISILQKFSAAPGEHWIKYDFHYFNNIFSNTSQALG